MFRGNITITAIIYNITNELVGYKGVADMVQSELHPSRPSLVTVCLAAISRDDIV